MLNFIESLISNPQSLLEAMYEPVPPNYCLREPKYHLIETIRPLTEIHWEVLETKVDPMAPRMGR